MEFGACASVRAGRHETVGGALQALACVEETRLRAEPKHVACG